MPSTGALVLAAAGAGFNGDVLQLIANSGAVAKAVLFLLLGFSVLSWAVILERHRALKRAERDSTAFLHDLHREKRLVDLLHRSDRYAGSPLSRVFVAGFRELTAAVTDGLGRRGGSPATDDGQGRILDRVQRRLDEAAAAEADGLDHNLGILATTGSVTPFVGLFGTVWGIMNAFQGIGVTGSASLAAVAPGISEALITTAAGLAAAIPAVIGYNLLLARVRRLGARIDRFVLEFAGLAEAQLDASRGAAPAADLGKLRV